MKKIFFVGNAHLDPVWMWRWREGSAEAKATIRSALDRMREYPDFVFVCSSASVYKWIEDFDSDMFLEMKERIDEGRFIIVGGWHTQPDCNLPSGEGFARQSLYSQRYFYEKFGKCATVGYNVDSFGHNLMIPQILRKSGMKRYVFMRPGEHEKKMPSSVFIWRSPDGSEVPCYRIHETYCQRFNDAEDLRKKLSELESALPEGEECAMMFYGVGNHGGGPTKHNIELILGEGEVDKDREYIFSTVSDYFDAIEDKLDTLPVHEDDLQHHASGCYSAVSKVKTLIRKSENELLSAETSPFLAARILGQEYATKKLAAPSENVLFAHFHDIAGGCSHEDSYTDTEYMLGESLSVADKTKNSALQTISWAIDTRDAERGYPIVVFNPLPYEVTTDVEINQITKKVGSINDSDGNAVPIQKVFSKSCLTFGLDDVAFSVTVPAFGYRTYYIKDDVREYENPLTVTDTSLENSHLRVEFEAHTGYVKRIYDKDLERELLSGFGAVPTVIDETGHDTWSHAKNFFTREVGKFSDATVKAVEWGPVRGMIEVKSYYCGSTLTQYFSLSRDGRSLDVKAEIDWHEKHKMLKIAYETAAKEPRACYEIPFGKIYRPTDGEEEPGYRWVAAMDDDVTYAITNNNKYSFSVKDSTLYLTAVRSPLYADHGWGTNPRSRFSDQGAHFFNYSFSAYKKNSTNELIKCARILNTPPEIIIENNHEGRLPDVFEGIRVSHGNVTVSALKRSEEGLGTVIRVYETEGCDTEFTVSGALLPSPLSARITKYSVDTYYLPDGEVEWKPVLLTEFDF